MCASQCDALLRPNTKTINRASHSLFKSFRNSRTLSTIRRGSEEPNNVDGASSDCFIPHIPPSRNNVDVEPSTPKTLNAEYESPKSSTISPLLHLE
ncbi:hypothetical protein QL285_021256 [Trifolium repens]|nr:hypothetical protein QL285_021256 [Trifolium repens]